MAGLVGFLDTRPSRDRAALIRIVGGMGQSMLRQDPTGEFWAEESAGLALSAASLSPSGRYRIGLDGDIFNYLELRRILDQEASPPWQSGASVEVLGAAIDHWGFEEALRRVEGRFAIALWDQQTRTLSLARDRVGEKPFYVGRAGSSVLFTSELRALLSHPDFEKRADPQAVSSMLSYGYVPAPLSIYQGVGKLAPGSIATVPMDGEIRHRRYFDLVADAEAVPAFDGDEAAAIRDLERHMLRSVSHRVPDDGTSAILLTGSVENSLIAATMRKASSRPVRSFSLGLTGMAGDPAARAQEIAQRLELDHSAAVIDPNECLRIVPGLAKVFDEPNADLTQLPSHLLMHMVGQAGVGKAVTGDGADILFGGNPHHRQVIAQWRDDRPISKSFLKIVPFGWLNLVSANLGRPGRFGDQLWREMTDRSRPSLELLYGESQAHWRIFDRPTANPAIGYFVEGTRRPQVDNELLRLSFFDAVTSLPDGGLPLRDRSAAMTGMEVGLPFLSYDLIRFGWGLPDHFKIFGNVGKLILRSAMERSLPRRLCAPMTKEGELPLASWLRGPLRDWAQALISSDRLAADGILDPEPIRAVWEEHLKGQRNWHHDLWNVLMLQSWREAWRV